MLEAEKAKQAQLLQEEKDKLAVAENASVAPTESETTKPAEPAPDARSVLMWARFENLLILVT